MKDLGQVLYALWALKNEHQKFKTIQEKHEQEFNPFYLLPLLPGASYKDTSL